MSENSSNFACFFDVDGVITKGPNVIPAAKLAIQKLVQYNVPFVFVSNTCMLETEKAEQLSNMLEVSILPKQVVLAHTPMRCLGEYHKKHVLICGQGDIEEIARTVGFKNTTTIDTLCAAFPELDMVDHTHRTNLCEMIKNQGLVRSKDFRPIEAVVLLGEPIHWETSLQIITDILLTHGNPNDAANSTWIGPHIPIIACNKDLVFKAFADIPRFGHGAFLTCLEALYNKLSSNDLMYTALVGKPYEISFQYSEMMANKLARSKGQPKVEKIYFVGDNPEVDIVGANVYNALLNRTKSSTDSFTGCGLLAHPSLLTAKSCESILVCTGVFDPNIHTINATQPWAIPTTIQPDVLEAVNYVLTKEHVI
ncbi:unnamed protein product [Rotaria sp. Silwood2]|nr:unnamed protein product [Rotaria sp. Silwood2]CAF2832060.1 unnamed protein product [Rotaria sp. Silwood2]CAF3148996.1 unnamed protein product [Rotaria sp. Silwood2]CAF4011662.1 unnamed protein product [Rotaria sp. Silwood2]CAF4020722.1 unnamed protein product [Rotaria sp. Silwood2]